MWTIRADNVSTRTNSIVSRDEFKPIRIGKNLVVNYDELYTLFQNCRRFSILLFTCKLALIASFLSSKFKRLFSLKRGNKKWFPRIKRTLRIRCIETRVEVWTKEKCCGNTSRRGVFPQLFQVSPKFSRVFLLDRNTENMIFFFF